MSETNGAQQKEKAAKVRRKPEHKSVLTPTFAVARQSTSGTLWDREQQDGGLLQRQCACGTHTIGGGECDICRKNRESSFLQRTAITELPDTPLVSDPAETHAFPKSSHSYDFSGIPAHTTPPSKPIIQPKLTVNPPRDQYEQEADRVADVVMRMPMPSSPPAFEDYPTSSTSLNIAQRKEVEKLENGKLEPGDWTKENREGKTQEWEDANLYNLAKQRSGQYMEQKPR